MTAHGAERATLAREPFPFWHFLLVLVGSGLWGFSFYVFLVAVSVVTGEGVPLGLAMLGSGATNLLVAYLLASRRRA